MKPRCSNQRNHALTLVEVLVVVFVLAVLVVMVILYVNNEESWPRKAWRINCANNMKEISLSFRLWAGDHNDKFPMQVSITDTNGGGTMELAATGNVVATFQIMSNELGTPKILWCSADEDHTDATNFTTDFNNSKISYFVSLDASSAYPQMLLSGDDNFEIGGIPVKSGLLEISKSTSIAWTAARHKFAGNILAADGSVQMLNNPILTNWTHQNGGATNRLAIP
jgi:prepilin-type processing-associated H-X9-DG protein